MGHTQTFISIGAFKTEYEANALLKYIKTPFARTLLGVLKITQDNKKAIWKYVPSQDFTQSSDIPWEKSISDIHNYLCKKYFYTEQHIKFMEKYVSKMD